MSEQWIEIFRTGTHTASNGTESTWTEGDLDQIVRNYDPKYHEAPAVIGHPQTDGPAYAWFDQLKRAGQNLLGRMRQIDPKFQESVNAGRYKKRSAAFYKLPDKGWYLRHVGFLGATPPAVKGLADVAFDDAGRGEIVTLEYSEQTIGGIFRLLAEWLIAQFDLETADRVAPEWDVRALEQPPVEVQKEVPAFNENSTQEANMADEKEINELKAKLAKEETEFAEARQKLAEAAKQAVQFAEAQQKLRDENAALKATMRRAEIDAKVDGWVKAGKITPALVKLGLPEFLSRLDESAPVEFAEGTKETASAFMGRLIESLPQLALFGELATKERAGDEKPLTDAVEIARKAGAIMNDAQSKGQTMSPTDAVGLVMKRK